MEARDPSNRRLARLSGALFLFVCVPLSYWGQSYVQGKVFVPQDPAATAANLLANDFLFRTGIVSHLFSVIAFGFMVLLLYRLFRPVDKHLSRLMVAPVLVQISVFLLLEVFHFTALMVVQGDTSTGMDEAQKQTTSYLLLRMHRFGVGAAQLFWGLCFIPMGLLTYRSGFFPRFIGVMLVVSGIGYVGDGCAYLLLQRPDYLVAQPFIRVTFIGFMVAMLWVLVKGPVSRAVSGNR